MSCVSWNVWGLGNPRTFNALNSLVLSVKPSFLFLIESRPYGSELLYFSRKFYDFSFHFVEAVGKAGGLIFGWRKSLEVSVVSWSMHHISFQVCNRAGAVEWLGTGF